MVLYNIITVIFKSGAECAIRTFHRLSDLLSNIALIGFTVIAILLTTTSTAVAQVLENGNVAEPPTFIVLGAGEVSEYEGAESRQVVPLLVSRTRIGDAALEVVGTQARLGIVKRDGFFSGPVLGFTGPRDENVSDSRVALFDSRSPSLELGAFGAWRAPAGSLDEGQIEIGSTLTSSAGGDWEGMKFTANAEYSWAATWFWRLAVGVSISAVNSDYANSRFGVSESDAQASGLAVYDPVGGMHDTSVSLRSILSFSPKYGLFTMVAYSRFFEDAANSPIVEEAGSSDQLFFGAGLFILYGK